MLGEEFFCKNLSSYEKFDLVWVRVEILQQTLLHIYRQLHIFQLLLPWGHATQSNARLPGFLSSETNVPFGHLLHWSLTYAKVSEKKPPETRSHEKKKKSNLEPSLSIQVLNFNASASFNTLKVRFRHFNPASSRLTLRSLHVFYR